MLLCPVKISNMYFVLLLAFPGNVHTSGVKESIMPIEEFICSEAESGGTVNALDLTSLLEHGRDPDLPRFYWAYSAILRKS